MGGYLVSIDESHENTYVRHMLSVYRGNYVIKRFLQGHNQLHKLSVVLFSCFALQQCEEAVGLV